MIFKRVDHVEIVPGNAEKTIAFYVDVLGFRIRSRKEMKVPPISERQAPADRIPSLSRSVRHKEMRLR